MFTDYLYDEERIEKLTKTLEKLVSMENASVEEKMQLEGVKCVGDLVYVQFDEVLMECGYFLACTAGNIIMTDRHFEELSENTKRFLLLHETGHQVYKHNEYLATKSQEEVFTERLNYISKNKVMPIELEADAYALNFMTKEEAYEALQEMQNLMDENFVDDGGEVAIRKELILK